MRIRLFKIVPDLKATVASKQVDLSHQVSKTKTGFLKYGVDLITFSVYRVVNKK
jgi:hypothetical protein